MAKLGISNNGIFIGAMSFPDRKKPCLVIEKGNEVIIIGTFNNVKCVDAFETALKKLIYGE